MLKSGLGFQVFNVVNDTIPVRGTTTREILERECKGVKIGRELGMYEALISNRKVREVLGLRRSLVGGGWRVDLAQSRYAIRKR
jgi:hypothetical protein